ncbi:hypothetical protein C8R44DRAFT_673125 [Mycena epipterygia]|nr:hypothetical protein C8R44DRAFT_673125 [Mycena epipterygia]
MATVEAFRNGVGPVVTTRGPGKIHLLTYQSNAGIPNHVGTITTTNTGVTRFIISHSYTFEGFAFYWDGAGEAVWTLGDTLMRQLVGKSWATATSVPWVGQPVTSADMNSQVSSAVVRDNLVSCFFIPALT